MNKVYNFEANFNEFLKSLNLAKMSQRRYLVFFRSFLNWIALKLQISSGVNSPKSILLYLTDKSLDKYRKFLLEAKLSKSSIQIRLSILKEYSKYLQKKTNIIPRNISNPINIIEESLLSEFLQELEEKGAGKSTIRSYRSDIRQFFSFLKENS